MRNLQKLELLYRRLGYGVSVTRDTMKVSRRVAGFDVSATFVEYDRSVAAMEFAGRIEKKSAEGDLRIIVGPDVSYDEREIVGLYARGAYTLTEWMNELLESRAVCEKLVEKYRDDDSSFLEPILEPGTFPEVELWALQSGGSEETLGKLVLFVGPAGFGKTTIARHLAFRLAEAHLSSPVLPMPLLISLEDFRTVRTWEDLLAGYSRGANIPEITPAALQMLIDESRVFLVIDGLDELAERGGIDAATETLRQLGEHVGTSAKLLVTARDTYVQRLKAVLDPESTSLIRVRGIVERERSRLLDKFGLTVKERAGALLQELQDDEPELASNPMFVDMVAQAVAYELSTLDTHADDGTRVPAGNGATTLELVLTLINDREAIRQHLGVSGSEYTEMLSWFAFLAAEEGGGSASENILSVPEGHTLITDAFQERLPRPTTPAELDSNKKIIARWGDSLRSHPFFVTETTTRDLTFRHLFYRDALAAVFVARQLMSGNEKGVTSGPLRVGEQITGYAVALLSGKLSEDDVRQTRSSSPAYPFVAAAYLEDCRVHSNSWLGKLIDSQRLPIAWREANLTGINLRSIAFTQTDFTQTDFTGTRFHRCRFEDCRIISAAISGATFEWCTATAITLDELSSHGIKNVALAVTSEGDGDELAEESQLAERYAKELLASFFRKFIRGTRGLHKRSVLASAFSRGIDSDGALFLRKSLLPLAERHGIAIYDDYLKVFRFNSSFQSAGDELLFECEISPSIKPFFQDLVEEVRREFF